MGEVESVKLKSYRRTRWRKTGGEMKKKVRIADEGEDRISKLPDELIHRIMFFLGNTKLAVQTSILSNRWKLIWKTLPFLMFDRRDKYKSKNPTNFSNFINYVFTHRDNHSNIHTLQLHVGCSIHLVLLLHCLKYAFLHNVQDLSVNVGYYSLDLHIFRSHSLKKLKLVATFECVILGEAHSWDLPALTTLELMHTFDFYNGKFLESCLICLPALTSLSLHSFILPKSLSLPSLTALRLLHSDFFQTVCNFPALVSLELDDVIFPHNMKDFFSALVSLQNLTWTFALDSFDNCLISCPQLLNLKIRTRTSCSISNTPRLGVNIVVSSPKLRNFDSVGIFTITCGVSSLEHVNIKLCGCFEDKGNISLEKLKKYYQGVTIMFPGLGGANILTLDLDTLEALSEVSDLLGHFPSPFYNLKYVQLPKDYKESRMSSTTKSYLLGGSPGATIVTTLPQSDVLTYIAPVLPTPRNVVFKDPLATATKEPVELLPKKVCGDGNYGLWQGFEVNLEFVDMLDLIMKKYPETFENFTSRSKKLGTMKLNLLCTSVNDFRKTSMTEFSCEIIAEYRELFTDLQRSFNIKWLVSRLNYIEQLHFPDPLGQELHAIDSHINDAKSNVKDLQTRFDDAKSKFKELQVRTDDAKIKLIDLESLRSHMVTAIEDISENMDIIVAASAGRTRDDLFSYMAT